ncbi:MAG: helix-turn-helix transcriptional regulator [Lachnospiraceae bacterium]|nr:helix-turn-helix transcriptional regulator [Lachnospiraceae bacterium]
MKEENKKEISEMLKKYRKMNNYSVKDVVTLLQEKSLYVAEKTLYGWESGKTQPNIETFFALCEIYKIDDAMSAFGYNGGEAFYITDHEKEIINQYRRYEIFHVAIDKLLDL